MSRILRRHRQVPPSQPREDWQGATLIQEPSGGIRGNSSGSKLVDSGMHSSQLFTAEQSHVFETDELSYLTMLLLERSRN